MVTLNKTLSADSTIVSSLVTDQSRRTVYSAPWNVTTDFRNACRASKQIPIVLVQALDKFMNVVADITDDVDDGSVTIDTNRGTRRTLQLRLVNEDGKYTPKVPGDYFYWNNLIRVHRGLRYIASDGIETDEYVCLGTFMVDRPEVFVERNMSVLTVDASDLYKKIGTGGFARASIWPAGTRVPEIISGILKDASIPPTQMCIDGLDDFDDIVTQTNMVSNPSFETNTTGWDSPTAPITMSFSGISFDAHAYYGSGATLTRTAATETFQAPFGDSYVLKVSGASCKAAHTTVTGPFYKGTRYYIRAFVRKVTPSDSYGWVNCLIGNSNYLETVVPSYVSDSATATVTITSWPYDNDDIPDDLKAFYDIDDQPYQEISFMWKPLLTYSNAELYFYASNITVVATPDGSPVITYAGATQAYTYSEAQDSRWARDYYLDSVYVGTLASGTISSDKRTSSPITWMPGDSRNEALQKLLTEYSLDGYFDVYGVYRVIRKKDPEQENPVWTFEPGEDSTMLGITRVQDDLKLINHIILTNENSDPYSVVVTQEKQVTDTTSPYHKSRIGDRVMLIKASQISSTSLMQTTIDNLFREYCSIAEEIKLPTICLPFLEGNDVIAIKEEKSDIDARYLCKRISIPFRETRMQIETTRSESVT